MFLPGAAVRFALIIVTRQDWLLLLLGLRVERHAPALDPVRVQKGMFVLAERNVLPAGERYSFEPYHYGPYSFELRDDLDALVEQGLVAAEAVPGYSWARYRLTEEGLAQLRASFAGADRRRLGEIAGVKQWMCDASFNSLLTAVYDEFPDYATRSVFQR